MTQGQYLGIGVKLPDAKVKCWAVPGRGWMVEVRANGQRLRCPLDLPSYGFTHADVLHRLLYVETNHATMFLRDFVAGWPDQSYRGHLAAVTEWIRLRRQRRGLKKLFPEDCP